MAPSCKAQGGGTVLSGGIAICGWRPDDLTGRQWLWKADLPAALQGAYSEHDELYGWANGTVRQLWVGGERRVVARTKLMRFALALSSGLIAKPGPAPLQHELGCDHLPTLDSGLRSVIGCPTTATSTIWCVRRRRCLGVLTSPVRP